jgi:hypothetical protein
MPHVLRGVLDGAGEGRIVEQLDQVAVFVAIARALLSFSQVHWVGLIAVSAAIPLSTSYPGWIASSLQSFHDGDFLA